MPERNEYFTSAFRAALLFIENTDSLVLHEQSGFAITRTASQPSHYGTSFVVIKTYSVPQILHRINRPFCRQ